MVLINEMRKNHGSNAISYLPKVGREGALSTEGEGAGQERGRWAKRAIGLRAVSTEGAVGRLGDGEQRGWVLCRKGGGEQRVGRWAGRRSGWQRKR